MLLVILGAGASKDFAAGRPDDSLDWRPQLTDGLVADNAQTRDLLNRIPDRAASGLVAEVRRKLTGPSGLTLEGALDEISTGRSVDDRDFLAFRLYLQALLRECSLKGVDEVGGATNQVLLVRMVEEWRRSRNEPVLYVTFNYDTILDQALAGEFGWSPESPTFDLRTYVERGDFKLFKLHGSWNWHQRTNLRGPSWFGPTVHTGELQRHLLDHAQEISKEVLVDDFRLAPNPAWSYTFQTKRAGYLIAVPALAVPLGDKATFMCPSASVSELQRWLPKVNHILTIGWKAGEHQFVEMLRQVKPGSDLCVVDPAADISRKVRGTLASAGAEIEHHGSAGFSRPSTFSSFIDGGLEAYLEDIS